GDLGLTQGGRQDLAAAEHRQLGPLEGGEVRLVLAGLDQDARRLGGRVQHGPRRVLGRRHDEEGPGGRGAGQEHPQAEGQGGAAGRGPWGGGGGGGGRAGGGPPAGSAGGAGAGGRTPWGSAGGAGSS